MIEHNATSLTHFDEVCSIQRNGSLNRVSCYCNFLGNSRHRDRGSNYASVTKHNMKIGGTLLPQSLQMKFNWQSWCLTREENNSRDPAPL